MFTGIVEATGSIADVKAVSGGLRLRIETSLSKALAPGASLAVNGVCLTVVVIDGSHVLSDIGPETVRVTTLGGLQRGERVNLERPLPADGRLDGHFVLGHVDAVGLVTDLRAEADSHWVTIQFRPPLRLLSSARARSPDGVSLTVAGLGDRRVRRAGHPAYVEPRRSATCARTTK
jgi:riboflavin synthase